jgi:hypothetical protein
MEGMGRVSVCVDFRPALDVVILAQLAVLEHEEDRTEGVKMCMEGVHGVCESRCEGGVNGGCQWRVCVELHLALDVVLLA